MDQTEIDRLESNFLAWITVASIFLAAAIIIKGRFGIYNIYYSASFLTIVVILLLITSSDYISERNKLRERGLDVFIRLDYLFLIIVAVIFICLFMIYDVLTYHHK